METILHNVLRFQSDCACFRRGEASANFGVSSQHKCPHLQIRWNS